MPRRRPRAARAASAGLRAGRDLAPRGPRQRAFAPAASAGLRTTRRAVLRADLAQPRPPQQAVELDAIDARAARRGADVAAVRGEELLEVLALEPAQPAIALDAQRLRHIHARRGARRDVLRGRLLEREAALDVAPELADVARPGVALPGSRRCSSGR